MKIGSDLPVGKIPPGRREVAECARPLPCLGDARIASKLLRKELAHDNPVQNHPHTRREAQGRAEGAKQAAAAEAGLEGARQVERRPYSRRDEQAGVLGRIRLERDREQMERIRKGVSRLQARAADAAAGRILGRADEGHPHRAQRRQDHVGARQRGPSSGRSPRSTAASENSSRNGPPPTRPDYSNCCRNAAAGSAATPGR